MEHRLSALAVAIDHQAEAPLRDSDLLCDTVCHQQEVPKQPIISLGRIEDGREVLTGNNQDMDRRLRVDVREGIDLVILVNRSGSYLSREDIAE